VLGLRRNAARHRPQGVVRHVILNELKRHRHRLMVVAAQYSKVVVLCQRQERLLFAAPSPQAGYSGVRRIRVQTKRAGVGTFEGNGSEPRGSVRYGTRSSKWYPYENTAADAR